jgi:hypothetical protein
MVPHLILALGTLCGIFILFLVISQTLNSTVNALSKIEYLLIKELDFKKESIEIKRILTEEKEAEQRRNSPTES